MKDKRKIIYTEEVPPPELDTQQPEVQDSEILTEFQAPALNTEQSEAQDSETVTQSHRENLLASMKALGKLPEVEDLKDNRKQFFFDGQWIADEDPLKIGEKNFSSLKNYRYRAVGIKGIQGYSKINTTALTIKRVKDAIQLRSPYTTSSYLVAQAQNAGATNSGLYVNKTDIPSQGDFEGTSIWDDTASVGERGRLSLWPQGHVGYCNNVDSIIYAGDEKIINSFIQAAATDDNLISGARDKTELMQSSSEDADSLVTIDVGASTPIFLMGSTRPTIGGKIYIKTPNAQASSLTVKYWNGTAWTAPAGLSDGTVSGGKSLAQTGFITWSTTETSAKVKYIEDRLLYWYRFKLSAGSAEISQLTIKTEAQKVKDIWDGVYRVAAQVQFLHHTKLKWVDFTMNAYTETPAGWYPTDDGSGSGGYGTGGMYPGYYIPLAGLSKTYPLQCGFDEPQCAMRIQMLGTIFAFTNNYTASNATVQYWNGTDWTDVFGMEDTTTNDAKTHSFFQSGTLSWNPPSDEVPKDDFGSTLFYYRIGASVQLTTTIPQYIWVDTIRGVTAPRIVPQGYKFPFMFQGRAMLCGYGAGSQSNRVDYSMAYAPDVWNGDDSSFGSYGPLYFGGDEALTGAVHIYNRFGASIYNTAIFTKATKTYLLDGYDAASWRIFPVSQTIGCPAPKTMDTAEVGYDAGEEGQTRNIALWLSHTGPIRFDAGTISPIREGVSCYFDPADSRCIEFDNIANSCGWVDGSNHEYNLKIPSGSGQSENNVWIVLDLLRKKWFEKSPNAASDAYIQCSVRVSASSGILYNYGFRDNGYMMRLENGHTWDGGDMVQEVVTSDQVPTGDIWDVTRPRRFKLLSVAATETVSAEISVYKDGNDTAATDLTAVSLNGTDRYVRTTQSLKSGSTFSGYSWKFKFKTSTSHSTKGISLLAWGYTFRILREDEG